MRTLPIIEQHFHGAYGIDFNKCSVQDVVNLSSKLRKIGIGGFFPTLVTDSFENTRKQIEIIKEASHKCSGILGIHLEGIFINKEKKGIHNADQFLEPTVENYKKLEDDFIKIVTLAPELDGGLIKYLKSKGVKVQAGHCSGWGDVDGVTHTFNAMTPIKHRGESTALKALIDDNVYAEIIADGVHVSDDALKLFMKAKPADKVILVSDALPITYSNAKEDIFAGSTIYYDGNKATSKDGTIAGSTKLLPEIIKILAGKKLFKPQYIKNVYDYHSIKPLGEIEWDSDFNVKKVDYSV